MPSSRAGSRAGAEAKRSASARMMRPGLEPATSGGFDHRARKAPSMSKRILLLAAVAVAALLSLVGCANAERARAAKLSPPVIHESFTLLPCKGKPGSRTTLELEGCAEHQTLRTDKWIDALEKTIFYRLGSDSARRDLIAASRAWLRYRHSDCLSNSDVDQGGTLATVVFADCVVARNEQRIKDLKTFEHSFPSG